MNKDTACRKSGDYSANSLPMRNLYCLDRLAFVEATSYWNKRRELPHLSRLDQLVVAAKAHEIGFEKRP